MNDMSNRLKRCLTSHMLILALIAPLFGFLEGIPAETGSISNVQYLLRCYRIIFVNDGHVFCSPSIALLSVSFDRYTITLFMKRSLGSDHFDHGRPLRRIALDHVVP